MRDRAVLRRLPNGLRIYVSPDAQLKYLRGSFDADLIELAHSHVGPGSVVWDIGANCGVFTFSCAHAKKVYAMEADLFLVGLINRSIARNYVSVTAVPVAVSHERGLGWFSIAKRGRASNHLSTVAGNTQTGGERSRQLVPTMSADDLLDSLEAPDLVKIDVEGAEVLVLSGAERLLSGIRPLIYLEVNDTTQAQCFAILRRHGYRMEKGGEMNYLCVPDSVAMVGDDRLELPTLSV